MSLVKMRKNEKADILVDSAAVTEHIRLGWEVAEIYTSADGRTMTVPYGCVVQVESGAEVRQAGKLAAAVVAVGEENADIVNVSIQLNDANGDALASRASLLAFLTDAAAGEAATATAPDGKVAVGTDGGCIHLTADKVFLLTSEADGDIDLDIEESGAATWYLVLVLPDGSRVVSDAITFAGA